MRSRKPYGTVYVIVAISVSLGLLLQVTGAAFGLVSQGQPAVSQPQHSQPAAASPLELANRDVDLGQPLAVDRHSFAAASFRPNTVIAANDVASLDRTPPSLEQGEGNRIYSFLTPPQIPADFLPDISLTAVEPALLFGPLSSLFSPQLLSSNSLGAGWNLVSIPEEVADTSPAAVLTSVSGSYDRVVAYDGCDAVDPWKVYDPADAASSDLAAIDHAIGFWINMTARASLEADGAQPASTNIPLCTGWNLIGYPLDQAIPVSAALDSVAGKYDRVFGWDLDDAMDPWAVYDVNAPAWVNDLGQMVPGYGYWVHALEDTTLTISGPDAAPVVAILTPAEGDVVTSPTTITGDVTASGAVSWVLESRLAGETIWTEFASGSGTGSGLDLGSFDPTMQLNGLHEIRLTATDSFGQSGSDQTTVVVEGEMKVGNFSISFVDLEIPVVGLPVQVIRTYDSRDKRLGDFGIGWQLDINDVRLQENKAPGKDWNNVSSGGPFPTYCIEPSGLNIVTITLPDGSVHKFRSIPSPQCQSLAPLQYVDMTFEPLSGTYGTLESLEDNYVGLVYGDLVDLDTLLPYNPNRYRLTTLDGTVLEIDQFEGLQRITDPHGNTVEITAGGLIHSAGKSVIFTRDAQDRISRISDPLGNSIDYTYDTNSDLVTVTDQLGNDTQFTYDSRHDLLDIIDARGVTAQRSEYDADGRLVAIIDADGKRTEFTHDVAAHQELVKDRLGNTTVYDYDDRGNVVAEVDALGNTTTSTYDANGNPASETNALGETTTFGYDSRENLTAYTNPLGQTTAFTYDAAGRILTNTDPAGNVTSNTYDGQGNLTQEKDPLGHVTAYTYDASGNVLSQIDPLGNVASFEYDSSGILTRKTDPLGHETEYTYDANGNQLSMSTTRTLSSGATETLVTQNQYDAANRLVQTTYPDGSTTKTEYNATGLPTATIDALGRHTGIVYDLKGDERRINYADGSSELFAYDAEGRKISATDRGGRTTTSVYDAAGRLVRVNYADGVSRITSYDAAGRPMTITNERGGITQNVYDAAGRLSAVTNSLGFTTSFTYDANGNKLSLTDANDHTTSFEYDANNQQTKTIFEDGTFRQTTYDALGRTTAERDQAGKTTRYTYDARGRLTQTTDASGQVSTFAHDELGNLLSQTDAEGRTTEFAYDSLGRTLAKTLPLGQSEALVYDAVGNVTSRTDFNGQTTTYTYDSNNWLTNKSYPGGPSVSYSYTASGQLAGVTDSRGNIAYSYDDRDRLTRVDHPDGSSISYTYDDAGNRTSLTIPSGTTSYTFDALNRLATVTDADSGMTTYSYDAAGSRAVVIYPNGTTASYTYDSLNRLTLLENKQSDGSVISSYAYTLAPAGNRTRVVEHSGRTVDYSYDDVYRLLEEDIGDAALGSQTISYTYDAVGNRLTKSDGGGTTTYSYDDNDRLLSEGGNSYSYDDNGNLLGKTGAGGDQITYTYDYEDRLTRITNTPVGGPVQTVDYLYDAQGNRVQKAVDGASIINYLVDTNLAFAQILEESDGPGNLQAAYVYGDDLIQMKDGAGAHYYHYDGLMSVRQLSDAAQTQTDQYVYDAFGLTLDAGGTTANSYLYTGEQYDPNAGFYYLRARYYSPATGRFVTTDPVHGSIFEPRTLHKYVYVANDPVNLIDPSGEFYLVIGTVITNAVAQFNRVKGAAPVVATGNTIKEQLYMLSFIYEFTNGMISLAGYEFYTLGGAVVIATSGEKFKKTRFYPDFELSYEPERIQSCSVTCPNIEAGTFKLVLKKWSYQVGVNLTIPSGTFSFDGEQSDLGKFKLYDKYGLKVELVVPAYTGLTISNGSIQLKSSDPAIETSFGKLKYKAPIPWSF